MASSLGSLFPDFRRNIVLSSLTTRVPSEAASYPTKKGALLSFYLSLNSYTNSQSVVSSEYPAKRRHIPQKKGHCFLSILVWILIPTHFWMYRVTVAPDHSRWHTPHSVWLLWTRDRPVAGTSTLHHTTSTRDHRCPRWDSNPQSRQASGLRPTP